MKFLHLADLHIGKKVNEISMLDEQRWVLGQVLEIAAEEQVQAVLLAGDIYDKPQPTAEAVQLFDWFLTRLAAAVPAVLMIAGNHDSAERLAFAANMLAEQGVYIAPPFDGEVKCVRLNDEFGAVDFYLLPFVKPLQVRRCFEDAEGIGSYDEAVARIMRDVRPKEGVRSVLLAHQLITGSVTCESEELAIGGLDNVDAAHFAAFDYVALGHLHGPQQVGKSDMYNKVRYAGSPLKYSFSEARQQKSVTLVALDADGRAEISTRKLQPIHDMREIKGNFADLLAEDYLEKLGTAAEDYLHITLTDEEDVLDAPARLRVAYPNLMKLDYDNRRTRERQQLAGGVEVGGRSPLDLFAEFYQLQNNQPLADEQQAMLRQLIAEIWEDEQFDGGVLSNNAGKLHKVANDDGGGC